VDLADEVWTFFRNEADVEQLGPMCGLHIKVFLEWFEPRGRADYLTRALDFVRSGGEPKTVLLDPDTGIVTRPKAEHVSAGRYTTGLASATAGRQLGVISTRLADEGLVRCEPSVVRGSMRR
jgi:hypothetical protein